MITKLKFKGLKTFSDWFPQGGLSSGYKKHVTENGLTDETYTQECVALIRISGTSLHNNKVLQVDAVCDEIILLL